MSGDTKSSGKSAFEIREMWSGIDALRGIVIVSSYEEVYFYGGVSGKLVAVMCDVVGLCVVCDVIASGCVERVLKGVE